MRHHDQDPRDWFERKMEREWDAELREQVGAPLKWPARTVTCSACGARLIIRTPSEPTEFTCLRHSNLPSFQKGRWVP